MYTFSLAEFEAQTAELIPKQGEPRAKVVFLLTLNGRALRQVRRLIRALYSSSHYFYIHVDSVGNQTSSNHIQSVPNNLLSSLSASGLSLSGVT